MTAAYGLIGGGGVTLLAVVVTGIWLDLKSAALLSFRRHFRSQITRSPR